MNEQNDLKKAFSELESILLRQKLEIKRLRIENNHYTNTLEKIQKLPLIESKYEAANLATDALHFCYHKWTVEKIRRSSGGVIGWRYRCVKCDTVTPSREEAEETGGFVMYIGPDGREVY